MVGAPLDVVASKVHTNKARLALFSWDFIKFWSLGTEDRNTSLGSGFDWAFRLNERNLTERSQCL